MKKMVVIFILYITSLSISAQPYLSHHYDICGTVEFTPDDTGYYLKTDLGYNFKFIQEIAFVKGTRLHVIGTTIDSCSTFPSINECILIESIEEFDCFAQYETCCTDIMGDMNGDGDIQADISDLLYIVDYMFKPNSPAPSCIDEADLYRDGVIDISDLIRMVDIIFNPIFSPLGFPPCPFDTVYYMYLEDTINTSPADTIIYSFNFKPEDKVAVSGLGVNFEGFYQGNSLLFYNFDNIDAQTVISATECGEWITGYMELNSIAGPVYKKVYFKKL